MKVSLDLDWKVCWQAGRQSSKIFDYLTFPLLHTLGSSFRILFFHVLSRKFGMMHHEFTVNVEEWMNEWMNRINWARVLEPLNFVYRFKIVLKIKHLYRTRTYDTLTQREFWKHHWTILHNTTLPHLKTKL